jgi:hypothetical protein
MSADREDAMRHETLKAHTTITDVSVAGLIDAAAIAVAVETELDRTFGPGHWSLTWDEDLAGRPVRGTIRLEIAGDSLIVG